MRIDIIAKGASLKGVDLSRIPRPRCGINDVITQVECDYCCFWDNPRWLIKFEGIAWTITPQIKTVTDMVNRGILTQVNCFLNKGTTIDQVNNTVPNINLSGILAISCAILEGFDEIYLWGYDGGYDKDRCFWDSPISTGSHQSYAKYNDQYRNLITPGVRIVNMNPNSKITCFDRI